MEDSRGCDIPSVRVRSLISTAPISGMEVRLIGGGAAIEDLNLAYVYPPLSEWIHKWRNSYKGFDSFDWYWCVVKGGIEHTKRKQKNKVAQHQSTRIAIQFMLQNLSRC